MQYDVILCGAGLAGLTLARQLRLRLPDLKILVIDRLKRPFPEAAFKVGESTIILGAAYLMEVARLKEYLYEKHVEKLGLRFFFSDGQKNRPLHERPELGRSTYLPFVTEWQIDRGAFETDVRTMIEADGVELLEGYNIVDVDLKPGDLHEVRYAPVDGGEEKIARAKWVIDATGRRRLLQKKLGHVRDIEKPCSSSWFRIEGRVELEKLVDSSEKAWFERVPGNHPSDPAFGRYNSTSHMAGDGYWVWVIPLPDDRMSIGIVASEDKHPSETFNTLEKNLAWLREHESGLYSLIEGKEVLDFRAMRKYSLATDRFLSSDRWGSTGEAASFVDPFLSLGTDFIGYSNTLLVELIALDQAGQMTDDICERFNEELLSFFDTVNHGLRAIYPLLGDSVLATTGIVWHLAFGSTVMRPMFANRVFMPGFAAKEELLKAPDANDRQYFRLCEIHRVIMDVLVEWSQREHLKPRQWEWIDYFNIPLLAGLTKYSGERRPSAEQWARDGAQAEAAAQAFFLLALEDTAPEKLAKLPRPLWLNTWALTLDDSKWEHNGIFEPKTPPQDVEKLVAEFKELYRW